MPDYSSLSDSDLMSLQKGDYSSLSNDGLLSLKRQSAPAQPSAPIGEMRRREGEGEIAAAEKNVFGTMPIDPYLRKAVDESRTLEIGGEGSQAITGESARTALATGARLAPIAAAAPFGPVAMAAGSALGETSGQMIESGKVTSPGAIAGSAAAGLVPIPGSSTSLLSSLGKTALSSLGAGLAYRTTKALVDGEKVSLEDISKGAGLDLSLGLGLQSLGTFGGAFNRALKSGEPSFARFVGEVQAPFEAEINRRKSENLSKFADSGAARELIGSVAGKIAQAYRQDPQAIAGILKDAVKNRATADEMVNAIKTGIGQLDENAANAIRQFSGSYEAMAAQDLEEASKSIGSIVSKGIQKAETKALSSIQELSGKYSYTPSETLTSTSQVLKNKAENQLSNFKSQARQKYQEVDSDHLFNDKFIGRKVSTDPEAGGVFEGKSINDLRDDLSNAYDAIDYTKPVQGAKFDKYAEVNKIQNELDSALESLPKDSPIVQKYKNANNFYKTNIKRFKGSYADSILREIGEEGGKEGSIIVSLKGTEGPSKVAQLKNTLGEDYSAVRDAIGQQIYSDLSSQGPKKFLENLKEAISGRWQGIQPEVINEFFPQATKSKIDLAFKYAQESESHPLRMLINEGKPSVDFVSKLSGVNGPQYLSDLKNALGSDFEQLKDTFGQQLYTKLSSGGPVKFVENLENALKNGVEGIQPKVIKEFLPQVDAEKVQAARNALNLSEEAFSKDFKKAIETGGELHNANPESLVSWFNKGENSYRANEAKKYLATDPELLGRSQDALLSQIISDSQVNGLVSGDSLRKVSAKYDKAISGLMGERGSVKIEAIASALDQAAKDASKTSILSKLIPLGAGGVAASRTLNATGSIPFTGSSMIAGTYAANKALNYANAQAASFLLNSPKYRAAVTKPYEELTNRETKMLEEDLPSIISRFSSR